jgi:Mg2+ and Co2+ transporter CorA
LLTLSKLLNMAAINQSDYTAEIAFETRRDSAAMKTIAVLTIVFLPGTFVATILSMDMFQWQPDDGGPATVSRLFWVYWVITIPLTAIVLAGWLIWTRKSVGKLRRFGEGKVDRTQTESPTLRRAPTTSSAAYSSGTSIQS